MIRPLPILAVLVAVGCSSAPAVYNGSVAKHSVESFSDSQRAVYANQIPVYPGAKIEDAMGSESWGDEQGSYSQGMCWWFTFPASDREKVVAFYRAAIPGVEPQTVYDGDLGWEFAPAGGRPKETISVIISKSDDKFSIREEVYGNRDEMIRNAAATRR